MSAETAVPLRSPDVVMKLARLGAMHPSRLSFARVLLRRIRDEGWRVTRATWELDPAGYGHAVYSVDTPDGTYSLVAFSRALAPEQRTDRVIAQAWDTSYVLYDGVPDAAALTRLASQVPLQEAGRFEATELILSRANKSVRLFDAVVQALAAGRQPNAASLDDVGYLMRTTAVYGNGKFGIADRDVLADRPGFAGPFQAEMLTVWLIRTFTVDLCEHCARALDPERAVPLAPDLKRELGVGNSTGLGMAPFLVRHPALLNSWITARETALARVRSLPTLDGQSIASLRAGVDEAIETADGWHTDDQVQMERIIALRSDLRRFAAVFEAVVSAAERPADALYRWAEANLGVEAQERFVSLLIEPFGALLDDLAQGMSVDERHGVAIDTTMRCSALKALIEAQYGWALALDHDHPAAQTWFWYVSAEKLEPRLGERAAEDGAHLEQPLAFARDVARLHRELANRPRGETVGALAADTAFRHVVRRVLVASRHPYAEIRDNLIDAAMRPIDLLRCKLAFFGANRFDPRSDRWLRITLFKGMPFPDEIAPAARALADAA